MCCGSGRTGGNLTETAYRAGYCDQPHFTKGFQELHRLGSGERSSASLLPSVSSSRKIAAQTPSSYKPPGKPIPSMDRMREALAEQFPRMSRWGMAAVVAFLALSATAFAGQSPSASRPDTTQPAEEARGGHGAVSCSSFGQGSRRLSPEEHSQLSLEIRAWAKQWIQQGHSFDPRALSPESFWITPDHAGKRRATRHEFTVPRSQGLRRSGANRQDASRCTLRDRDRSTRVGDPQIKRSLRRR